jgi:hypothetical protein
MMHTIKQIFIFSIVCVSIWSLVSCGGTKLTSVWKDTTYEGTIDKIMVVSITENTRNRLIFEREFVEAFRKAGVLAIASVDITPKNLESNEDFILAEARKQGISMILVTHLIGVEDKEVYHPPKTYTVPSRGYYNHFHSYYPRVYEYVHEPGYYTKHKSVNLETNLYETKTEKLVWSVTSETIDPESVDTIIKSLSKVVIKDLRKQKLLN